MIFYMSRAKITVGGDKAAASIVPAIRLCSCAGTSPPTTTVTSFSGSRPPLRGNGLTAVCCAPPLVGVPKTLFLRPAIDLISPRAASQNRFCAL